MIYFKYVYTFYLYSFTIYMTQIYFYSYLFLFSTSVVVIEAPLGIIFTLGSIVTITQVNIISPQLDLVLAEG